jgi:uncharacterized protein
MDKQFFSENKWSLLICSLVLIAGMALAFKYARPAVPKEVVMSTGVSGGAYDAFAKRYAEALAEEGIKLTLRPSKGAVENLERIQIADGDVDVTLVQNGLSDRDKNDEGNVVSLGSMFYETVLVFYRKEAFAKPVSLLGELKSKRVAVGPEGSGTRVLGLALLALHDVTASNTNFVSEGGEAAAQALRAGTVDVAIFVGNPTAPLVQKLFTEPTLAVADLELSETYSRRLSEVAPVVLPLGVIDIERRIPAQAVRTVATTSSLVAREDIHPAVLFLLMRGAKKMHARSGPVAKVNEFPSFSFSQDFPPSTDAERLLKEGAPFLYRYLPFKVANFASRAIVFLIPLLAVLVSLSDWIPKIVSMRVKGKLYAHYKEMKTIDEAVRQAKNESELNAAAANLDALDAQVGRLKIPTNYSNDQFGIRDHLDLVRVRIERRREALAAA